SPRPRRAARAGASGRESRPTGAPPARARGDRSRARRRAARASSPAPEREALLHLGLEPREEAVGLGPRVAAGAEGVAILLGAQPREPLADPGDVAGAQVVV